MCIQDSIQKMEEYNLGMKNAVQLWDATAAAAGGLPRQPHSKARHVAGGCRPLTGSEARTLIARCARSAISCICALLVSPIHPYHCGSSRHATIRPSHKFPLRRVVVFSAFGPSVLCASEGCADVAITRVSMVMPPTIETPLAGSAADCVVPRNTTSVQNCTR